MKYNFAKFRDLADDHSTSDSTLREMVRESLNEAERLRSKIEFQERERRMIREARNA